MLRIFCIIFLQVFVFTSFSQNPISGNGNPKHIPSHNKKSLKISRIQSETCNNGIDDDNNGLLDCEDYSCYFSSSDTTCQCQNIDIVWICTSVSDLFWVNLLTGVETYVGSTGIPLTDITWTDQGSLYGVDWLNNQIWQIDPSDASRTFVMSIPGYDASNAMTSDADGNLYLASRVAFSSIWHIIKINLFTSQITVVADLSVSGLISAGDLAFSNGSLYLACQNNILAKINVNTGTVTSQQILGLPAGASVFGIVSLADGSIYLSDIDRLYKLNLATMQATLYYTFTNTAISIWGLSNFNDYCNAPAPCLANISISVLDSLPYCSNSGVRLKAEGSGIVGDTRYVWTLPNGATILGDSIVATQSGIYKVRYHSIQDSCGAETFIDLNFKHLPDVKLGIDTILCNGSSIVIGLAAGENGVSYSWQNNVIGYQLQISEPGLYWLEGENECGIARDTIIINKAFFPRVNLGADRDLCFGDTLMLRNVTDSAGYQYLWSTGSTAESIVVENEGMYSLSITNECGARSDTVLVKWIQEDCECFIFVPTAFTPNRDGKNDLFRIHSNCFIKGEISIYNRWGQLVYQSNDLSQGWNGELNSLPQSSSVFVYLIKYRFGTRPGIFQKHGSFVLIR